MKKANKFISFLLAIMLLLGCITPISVSAATVTTFCVNNVSAQPGETITIPVMVKNNTGFVSASLYIEYDSSVLTLIGAKDKGLIDGAMHTTNFVSPYILSWENDTRTSNYTVNGTIVELSFSVSTFADPGEYSVKISSPTHGVLDCNGEEVDCSFVNGKVTVVAPNCDHDWSSWKKSSASRHKRSCALCGEVEYDFHNFDDGEIVEEPSHGVDGEIEYTCDDCGYVDSDILDAEEHDWSKWTKFSDTQHKRTCSCGDVEYEDHNWDAGVITKQPTATTAGVRTYTCEDCSATKTESISPNTIVVTGVSLNKTSETLKIGDSLSLTANVAPSNASNKNVTWSSSNSYVASIVNGVVTANGAGTATITVTTEDGGFVATCIITVEADPQPDDDNVPVTSIQLDKTSMTLALGISVRLKATIVPGNATNQNIVWSSSNPSVASVSNGLVTANKAGTTIITATTEDGGFVATCNVTVKDDNNDVPVTGVTFDKSNVELILGGDDDSTILNATIAPANATNTEIIWENSNESVVDMAFFDGNNSKVLLVALSEGTATITATTSDGNFVAICVVTVAKNETSDYSEGLEYTSNGDGTCYVSGMGTCTDTEIVIPNSYGGETVVGIGKNAFANQYNILSVSLGENILTIDEKAFYNCRGLSNVDFNINLVSIGDSAFYNCAFTSVKFSDNITHIGEFAFNHCDELTTVTLSDSLTHIGKAAFLSCSAIKSILIPCNVESIDDAVFGGCESMTTIIVDEQNPNFCSIDGILYDKKVSTIISCPATKTSVSIPSSVTVVGNDAFRECTALTSIALPENVVKIGSTAFYECNNLKSINIPSGVIEIGDNAFYNCKNISSLTLPEGLEKIGNSAFWKCSQLTNINIPTTVTFIGGQAFESCKMLTKIIIPDSVTFIGYYSTFSDCKALTEITISCNISSLPNYAFRNCTSLTTINFSGTKNHWDSIAKGVDWDENTGNYVINYLGEDDPTPPAPTTTATIVVDSKEVMPGETIKVNINLADNPGLASLVLKVSYDQSLLTLTNVEYNTSMGGQTVPPASLTSPVTLYWVNGFANYDGNGVFATLTFTVSETAKEGDVANITVTYNADDVFNINDENVNLNITAGKVTVIDYVPGDINGDGVLNNKDVTRFMQYNAGWDVEVNTAALDVNGDGSVNNKDVTRLMQYNAGWDVEIH